MSNLVECDICRKAFRFTPGSIIDCYTMEEWEEPLTGDLGEPDDYLFVCPKCEKKYVFIDKRN